MSDVKLPTDFTVDERKAAWGLIYELFDMAPIDPTDQWKLAALLLRARALPQAWVCAKCGAGSVEHGMPNHPANQCVYEPTLITVPPALTPKQEAADEMCEALEAYKRAQEAFEEELEIKERAFCEGWDNDPTGSSHVVAAVVRAAAANKRAEELTTAALAKAGRA